MEDRWDRKYAGAQDSGTAATVLSDNLHLLPRSGKALDIACGLGANAMLLASRGLETHAWDASSVAIELLQSFAFERNLQVIVSVKDVNAEPPASTDGWNVVVVSHFLERSLCRAISDSLGPGGLLFYQTFTLERVSPGGPGNPEYLLRENELLDLFPDLVVRYYREEGVQGDTQQGHRNKAYLIGQKPLDANPGVAT
jgi:2-polyprenyl-3-methyl-5-hydroxy-6-metoxy-1,4-benzoquinol methylase